MTLKTQEYNAIYGRTENLTRRTHIFFYLEEKRAPADPGLYFIYIPHLSHSFPS